MKEEGDWSSERRRPHGSTTSDDRSSIPDWASLPPELVEKIADCVLSTTAGVDAYMDMRAVCPSWRSAITEPSPLAAFTDHRFRPRHWVMVDLKCKIQDDDARLFLHTTTGRFCRLHLPVLRDYTVLGASDGLIVLRDRDHPHLARVLNPLTGAMLQFPATLWDNLGAMIQFALSGGPSSTLVLWEYLGSTFVYAYPSSAEFTEEEPKTNLYSMVTFQGNIYYAGSAEDVLEFVAPAEQGDYEPVVIAKTMWPDVDIYLEGDNNGSSYARSYLVESAGELLLVLYRDQDFKVFKVDVEHKLLEEVKSLGCRALFLGAERCVSVNADKLPSVEADCIYMYNWVETSKYRGGRYMHVYDLRDAMMEILYTEPMLHCNIFTSENNHRLAPLSLVQVLLDYCNVHTSFYD